MTLPTDAVSGLGGSTAKELLRLLRAGEISAREVLEAHLAVINELNPTVNAVCTLSLPRAYEEASRADEAFARGELVGPLHGLPILHKDVLDTAGVKTTYGAEAYRDHVPATDSLIVARSSAAGAVMMGKTNTPQFATGGHTSNRLFGTTVNPLDPSRSAGGSSGGSAAALAAGMAPLATGTDMAGSLRVPAAFCGVVGLRPTPGRIPWWPAPEDHLTFVVAGPMARNVDDLSLLLAATAGPDSRAPLSLDDDLPAASLGSPGPHPSTFRVAWAPGLAGLPVAADVAAVLHRLPEVLRSMGVAFVEDEPDLRGAESTFRVSRAWYYARSYGRLLTEQPEVLDERTAANTREGLTLRIDDLERADVARMALEASAAAFFAHHDILLVPCAPVTAFPAEQWVPETVDGTPLADYLDWLRHLYFVTAMGVPALSLPVGLTAEGLPVAVQVVAGHGRDLHTVRFARYLEAALALPTA